MSKLNAILDNPDLEEHIIYYVGIRHMQLHWENYIDYELPYEWDIQELFYKEMKHSTLQGLKDMLRRETSISDKDPDFKQTLDAAISIIVARHGMDAIVATAREFLHVMTSPETQRESIDYEFSVPAIHCYTCGSQGVTCVLEDLPAALKTKFNSLETSFGYCLECKTFFLRK
jgi:hypothetical protein